MMSTEANKAVARRYFDEFLNQGKGTGDKGLFAPSYRSYFPGSSGPLDKQEKEERCQLGREKTHPALGMGRGPTR